MNKINFLSIIYVLFVQAIGPLDECVTFASGFGFISFTHSADAAHALEKFSNSEGILSDPSVKLQVRPAEDQRIKSGKTFSPPRDVREPFRGRSPPRRQYSPPPPPQPPSQQYQQRNRSPPPQQRNINSNNNNGYRSRSPVGARRDDGNVRLLIKGLANDVDQRELEKEFDVRKLRDN